ncbi:MAG TPA: hypothetical protein PLI45_04845 [Candidatus Woesebacteria bacterium]|nr:hypothetical protein [Candidatus Woesebacteria bacterium]
MRSKLVRSIVLAVSIILISFWTSTPSLNSYNLQLTGALILLYFASKYIFRRTSHGFYFTALILVSITLLLVFSTGGINSPLFFILDFLAFATALLISPYQAVIASLTLVSIFLWQNLQLLNTPVIVNLASLVLITPLAVIFGKTYLKNLQSEGKVQILKEAIKDEQVDSLLWISTTAKPSLAGVLNSITDIIIYFNSKGQKHNLPKALIDKLKNVQNNLISLYVSAGILEKSIEESSDKMEL